MKLATWAGEQPRNLSIWFILAGVLIAAVALYRGFSDYRDTFSPLDQVPGTQAETSQGFLPMYAAAEAHQAIVERAPALSDTLGETASTLVESAMVDTEALANPAGITPAGAAGVLRSGESSQRTPAQPPAALIPDTLVIPALNIRAPIVDAGLREVDYQGVTFQQWLAPDEVGAVGWHPTTAPLGISGNTVLNGHHNTRGEVFRNLGRLNVGDTLYIYSGDQVFTYLVQLNMILQERFQPIEIRLENARWIAPSEDERITLISCWPYESNSHRVVVVAVPAAPEEYRGISLD